MPVPHALGELDLDSQRDWREVFNHEVFEHVLRPQDVINKVRIELSEVVLVECIRTRATLLWLLGLVL